jgi:hypothetical protein
MADAYESYGPLAVQVEVPPRLSDKMLIDSFRSFAFNNAAFRTGLIDELAVTISTSEEMAPDELPLDHISTSYEFEAIRERFIEEALVDWQAAGEKPEDKPQERRALCFRLSVIAVRDAIPMPAHIAIDQYGIQDAAEAVDNAGSSAVKHEVRYQISTDHRVLRSSESYEYIDCRGDIVAHLEADTAGFLGAAAIEDAEEMDPGYGYLESGDDDFEEGNPEPISLLPEGMTPEDAEEVAKLWLQLAELEEHMDMNQSLARHEDEMRRQAYRSFYIFKESLRKQLGL